MLMQGAIWVNLNHGVIFSDKFSALSKRNRMLGVIMSSFKLCSYKAVVVTCAPDDIGVVLVTKMK